MRYKGRKRLKLTGLTMKQIIAKKIKHNTDEYEEYKDASAWLEDNSEYVRFTINKLLGYYKYAQFKSFRLDLHQDGFLVVLDRFPKYKPGLRSVNSWLYQQIQWYVGKILKRKYIAYYGRTVGFPEMDDMHRDYYSSPELIMMFKEIEVERRRKDKRRGSK